MGFRFQGKKHKTGLMNHIIESKPTIQETKKRTPESCSKLPRHCIIEEEQNPHIFTSWI